jgi:diaminohydroxyphosphoribosylaminopyrimidine deaminase/5-amino-6-(5-phosphoribosylamino)uracil reductase
MACADAIAAARPARAVIALRDPDPRTSGEGIERLKAAGIEVREGVLAADAIPVVLGHLLRVTEGRPAITLKLAVGSDGLLPKGVGAPVWITGPDARAHGHLLRARSDAILVGRGTILADNPSLTCRLPGMSCRSPVRVVLDRRLRTPPQAHIFDDVMVPVWLICAADEVHPNAETLHDRGAEIVPVAVDDHGLLAVRDALETLAQRGITRVLVEGGPSVARAFLDADLIDEAVVYQGPDPAGADGLLPFVSDGLDRLVASGHFTRVLSRSFGQDRMTCWRRARRCSLALSAA